jgi:ribosomal protein L19
MSYFSFFPTRTNYQITLTNENNTDRVTYSVSFPDFYRHAALAYPRVNDGRFFYKKIEILDGERPEQLSQRLYGTPDHYWTFFIINDNLRLGEALQWPLSQRQLQTKIDIDYSGVAVIAFKSKYIKKIKPSIAFSKENYLYDKFEYGETVEGAVSRTKGVVENIRPNHGQLIIRNLSNSSAATPMFLKNEAIIGNTSGSTIVCDQIVEYKKAPMEYVDILTGRTINNRNFILSEKPSIEERIGYITFEQNLMLLNDSLRTIKVLKPDSVRRFSDAVSEILRRNVTMMTTRRVVNQ